MKKYFLNINILKVSYYSGGWDNKFYQISLYIYVNLSYIGKYVKKRLIKMIWWWIKYYTSPEYLYQSISSQRKIFSQRNKPSPRVDLTDDEKLYAKFFSYKHLSSWSRF